jgi:hypothetical protein
MPHQSDFQRFFDDSGIVKRGFARKLTRENGPLSAVGRSAYLALSSWFNLASRTKVWRPPSCGMIFLQSIKKKSLPSWHG